MEKGLAINRQTLGVPGGASLMRTGDLRIMIPFDCAALVWLCLCNQVVRSVIRRYAMDTLCFAMRLTLG